MSEIKKKYKSRNIPTGGVSFIKKKPSEPSITDYLTYRKAKKLMEKLKINFGTYPWKTVMIDENSFSGCEVKITHKSFKTGVPPEDLAELLNYIMKLNVTYWIYFNPKVHSISHSSSPHSFSIDIQVR